MVKFSIKQPAPPPPPQEEIVWALEPNGANGIKLTANGWRVLSLQPYGEGMSRHNLEGRLPSCIVLTSEGYIATHTEVLKKKGC